jgi:uncharacterized delta-60 repeat protein
MVFAPAVHAVIVAQRGGLDSESAGFDFDTAMVDGRPAVVWAEGSTGTVKYARAMDAAGTAWGPPVTLDQGALAGTGTVLQIVNGNPAVCYYKAAPKKLAFLRAADTTGAAWGSPVLMDPGVAVARPVSLEVAGGNPVLAFMGSLSGFTFVIYVRSTDANGAAWGTPVWLTAGNTDAGSMTVVEGLPAIAYIGDGGLWYRRAADVTGTTWNPRVSVALGAGPAVDGCVLRIADGHPAICYRHDPAHSLKYVRAADAAGATWDAPITLDTAGTGTERPSLAVVNGKPFVVYNGLAGSRMMVTEATESNGAAWRSPVPVTADGTFRAFPKVLDTGGIPALMYIHYNRNSIEYTRAVSPGGADGTRWLPFPVVEQPAGYILPSNYVQPYGVVPVGGSTTIDCVLRNPSTASVDLNASLTLEGPDAAEFSILPPLPPAVLAPGSSAPFAVKYAPVTPGKKSVVLHVVSNAETPANHYTITMEFDSAPGIAVEHPAGVEMEEGSPLTFPVTIPGSPALIDFTVKNPGGADLNNLTVTIDGPDRAEFSVAAALPPSIPHGGTATFTVRHAPPAAGARFATLHVISNVEGALNPFDIPLRMVPGTGDESFTPLNDRVTALALEPNGRILAGGSSSLTAFNPDGSFDLSFFSPSISGGSVRSVAALRDGRIIIAGNFTEVSGLPREGMARLFPDGTIDASFNAGIGGGVSCMAVQPDGRILAGGSFQKIGGEYHPWLARFASDGARDASFQPELDRPVHALALQPDRKVLAGGSFFFVSSIESPFLARFNADGSRDAFAPIAFVEVFCLALWPDGEILSGTSNAGILRRLPDGSASPNISVFVDNSVFDLALQADGKCLAGGKFSQAAGLTRKGMARFNKDGAVDAFDPAPIGQVIAISMQADGKVLIAGDFSKAGGITRQGLARLNNEPAVAALTQEGRTTLRWMRSGAAPEVSDVSFEINTPGDPAWSLLGFASRIPGGWELNGLTLPASGSIRALGRAGGSLVQEITPLLTPLESWRLQYFNIPTNTGDAANDADPDRDGLTNFTEFAFGLDPTDGGSNTLPPFVHTGAFFSASFVASAGREDLVYAAERSTTMLPGTWTEIPDTGTGGIHTFSIPGTEERIFVRYVLKIR